MSQQNRPTANNIFFNRLDANLLRQLSKFGITGFCSSLVHFTTVMLLVNCVHLVDQVLHLPFHLTIIALCANIAAFFIAFTVSYEGHSNWTFAPQCENSRQHHNSMQRFFLVASMSFILNESLYYGLLKYTHLNYAIALIMVICLVSMLTFGLSKTWAFQTQSNG